MATALHFLGSRTHTRTRTHLHKHTHSSLPRSLSLSLTHTLSRSVFTSVSHLHAPLLTLSLSLAFSFFVFLCFSFSLSHLSCTQKHTLLFALTPHSSLSHTFSLSCTQTYSYFALALSLCVSRLSRTHTRALLLVTFLSFCVLQLFSLPSFRSLFRL